VRAITSSNRRSPRRDRAWANAIRMFFSRSFTRSSTGPLLAEEAYLRASPMECVVHIQANYFRPHAVFPDLAAAARSTRRSFPRGWKNSSRPGRSLIRP
jgi:hypothetical protein